MRRLLVLALCGAAALSIAIVWGIFFTNCLTNCEEDTRIYIYEDHTPATVGQLLQDAGVRTTGFALLSKVAGYKVRTGMYTVRRGDNLLAVFRRLRNGQQEPLNLTIPSVRTLDRLAEYLGEHLMLDAATFNSEWAEGWSDGTHSYTRETLPALFIPNTYQVYWNTSYNEFMQRMQRENDAFWTAEREAKAKEAGLSRIEVATLASIVDEETANNGEKPMVAGMYMKRISVGMPLQADPTVKFAIGDFTLRRIYQKHLAVESPYNTYKHAGLPPGPIRIASVAGIDAVLNYVHCDYLYMCAKEDFSGTHNFARTYAEHLANARKYVKALNERGIK